MKRERASPNVIAAFAGILLILASDARAVGQSGKGGGPRDSTITNSAWSGYGFQAPSGTTVSSVEGSWTVPKVNPSIVSSNSTAYAGFWVGIDGYGAGSTTVEQIGVDGDVSNGAVHYYAWYEMYPGPQTQLSLSIFPGDSISASVAYVSSNSYEVSITDTHNGSNHSYSQKVSPPQGSSPSRASAEWIAEAPSSAVTRNVLGLSEFGTVTFTGASATLSNGTSGPISTFSYDSFVMSATSSGLGATPSPLDPTGTSFTIATTWPGDVNSDGRVDINDLTIVLANYGKSSSMWWATGDMTGDGTVDINDLTLVLASYDTSLGTPALGARTVPEPTYTALWGGVVGWLGFAWWRRLSARKPPIQVGRPTNKWPGFFPMRPHVRKRSSAAYRYTDWVG